ncbi:MAG: exodeoxyribonuclease III [Paludibacterium sp.]|uniref:exodeoxyribonuclease III n=1 Tax=Paludibacterium sp. TaxID=1917523 RepID=UPI0025F22FE3|nr:exodeoxyribonuclease III [Paludibacterium sp.]MBV8046072.1 exodeoxyribonuclease III [Paludibacterium sp.]MBV8646161.1 exodeoxyribonuclease III [Paludibacterium sp.]
MKLATWNVNSLKVRLPHVLDWLASSQTDVLCLQELKLEQEAFPEAELAAAGYGAAWFGQKTYNGVAILTRLPLAPRDVVRGMPNYPDPQSRVIAATVGDIRVICAYFVNGEAITSDKYQYKLAWLAAMQHYVAGEMRQHDGRVVLLGDFNIAPADSDVYDPAAWQDKVLCSQPERAAFEGLLALGLTDGFRRFHPDTVAYSWWDYRAAMFRRNLGLRIDHILYGHALAERVRDAAIDTTPRRWERPSDHTPVWLALDDSFST